MYIISFANPKGGTGKTTSTFLLAEQLSAAGGRVKILDLDPNENLLDWQKNRVARDQPLPFEVLQRPNKDDEIIDTLDSIRDSTDFCLIDLEGTASQAVTYSLSQSDLVLIPLEPNSVEAKHAARAVKLVSAAEKMLKRSINYRILFTRCNAAFASREETEVRAALAENDIPLLSIGIVKRSPYSRMFGESQLLSEMLENARDKNEQGQIQKAIRNAKDFTNSTIESLEGSDG